MHDYSYGIFLRVFFFFFSNSIKNIISDGYSLSRYTWTSNSFFSCWTIDVTFTSQIPGVKVPQFPLGVPMLAKLIMLMCHPCSQFSRTSGVWDLDSWFGFQESAGRGSASDTCAHISHGQFLLAKKSLKGHYQALHGQLEGSPQNSSWLLVMVMKLPMAYTKDSRTDSDILK